MANVSEWSANELENLCLDDMSLSDERGRRAAKIMAAVKAKEDEQDAKLDAVAGGLVFRGTKATYADLEAVEDPAVGDMYSVTALGGENYAWNGEVWDALGTSDANVVHKTGDEEIKGEKTFSNSIYCKRSGSGVYALIAVSGGPYVGTAFDDAAHNLIGIQLRDINNKTISEFSAIKFSDGTSESGIKFNDLTSDTNSRNGWVLLRQAGSGSSVDTYISVKPDLYPYDDNSYSLGNADHLWTQLYAATPSISTSDERIKTSIQKIDDAVLDAWGNVGFVQFQMRDAVEEKGSAARLHTGLVAQRIDEAFSGADLDASRYGLFCYDQWGSQPEELNEDGTVRRPAKEAGDVYSLRYEEALCLEAAYQRRRADRLEARIAALEARLNGND